MMGFAGASSAQGRGADRSTLGIEGMRMHRTGQKRKRRGGGHQQALDDRIPDNVQQERWAIWIEMHCISTECPSEQLNKRALLGSQSSNTPRRGPMFQPARQPSVHGFFFAGSLPTTCVPQARAVGPLPLPLPHIHVCSTSESQSEDHFSSDDEECRQMVLQMELGGASDSDGEDFLEYDKGDDKRDCAWYAYDEQDSP